jgi:hypothetical protein
MVVAPDSVDMQKFVLVVEGAAVVLLELAMVELEIAELGVSLLVFSFFFVEVEKVDFPLG